jgi:hypothetical protein
LIINGKEYKSIIVTDSKSDSVTYDNRRILAMITEDKIVEHGDIKVYLEDD